MTGPYKITTLQHKLLTAHTNTGTGSNIKGSNVESNEVSTLYYSNKAKKII